MKWMSFAAFLTMLVASTAVTSCGRSDVLNASKLKLEIREVRCTEQTSEYSYTYTCQGTLLSRDSQFQNADVIVWYQDVTKTANKKEGAATNPPMYVKMSNGVATLQAGAYYSRKHLIMDVTSGDFDKDPGAPDAEWNVIGYSRLGPVEVTVEK